MKVFCSLVASKFKIFSLNTHQKRAISLVAKRGKDVFVNLPTGYGKSLIYQALPTVFDALRSSSGHVVVVSPLISLLNTTANGEVKTLTNLQFMLGFSEHQISQVLENVASLFNLSDIYKSALCPENFISS